VDGVGWHELVEESQIKQIRKIHNQYFHNSSLYMDKLFQIEVKRDKFAKNRPDCGCKSWIAHYLNVMKLVIWQLKCTTGKCNSKATHGSCVIVPSNNNALGIVPSFQAHSQHLNTKFFVPKHLILYELGKTSRCSRIESDTCIS